MEHIIEVVIVVIIVKTLSQLCWLNYKNSISPIRSILCQVLRYNAFLRIYHSCSNSYPLQPISQVAVTMGVEYKSNKY